MEEWKDIQGFEGWYQISNYGNIKSLDRFSPGKNNSVRHLKGAFMKLNIDTNGYHIICLYKNKIRYDFKVHRLVAQTFIPNPDNLPEVNHIDGNKLNNHVDNLEWVTRQDNCIHRQQTGLGDIEAATIAKYKPIISTNLTTGEQLEFNSLTEASQFLIGCTVKGISKVLRGGAKTHRGYTFEYKTLN